MQQQAEGLFCGSACARLGPAARCAAPSCAAQPAPPLNAQPRRSPPAQALALHLIEGVIDQVDSSVSVSWVQPRILTLPQASAARTGLGGRVVGCAAVGRARVRHATKLPRYTGADRTIV